MARLHPDILNVHFLCCAAATAFHRLQFFQVHPPPADESQADVGGFLQPGGRLNPGVSGCCGYTKTLEDGRRFNWLWF